MTRRKPQVTNAADQITEEWYRSPRPSHYVKPQVQAKPAPDPKKGSK